MKIAVVGSGISGLVAARRLSEHHDVHVFEAAHRIGGHTHTVDVDVGGKTFSVDTGFIVFNETNYPEFTGLLNELGVRSRPTSMSFSVRDDRSGVEYNGTSLNTLFAQRRNALRPTFLRMIADILRFNRIARSVFEDDDPYETIDAWVRRKRFSRTFVEDHLMPLGASLWSCPVGTFRTFPIRFLVRFMANHGMLAVEGRPTWRTVVGGSNAYIDPLIAPFRDRVHVGTPVLGISRDGAGVSVKVPGEDARFDHVVLACHSDQAVKLLEDPHPTETEVVGSIRYQENDVVLHTDTRLLPHKRLAWAAWNYRVSDGVDGRPPQAATVTYDMNILQGLDDAPVEFCVSLNQTDAIDPSQVIRRMTYEHPVFDVAAERARSKRAELARVPRTSYCGAYWGWGFHEDGVRSALQAVEELVASPVA